MYIIKHILIWFLQFFFKLFLTSPPKLSTTWRLFLPLGNCHCNSSYCKCTNKSGYCPPKSIRFHESPSNSFALHEHRPEKRSWATDVQPLESLWRKRSRPDYIWADAGNACGASVCSNRCSCMYRRWCTENSIWKRLRDGF